MVPSNFSNWLSFCFAGHCRKLIYAFPDLLDEFKGDREKAVRKKKVMGE